MSAVGHGKEKQVDVSPTRGPGHVLRLRRVLCRRRSLPSGLTSPRREREERAPQSSQRPDLDRDRTTPADTVPEWKASRKEPTPRDPQRRQPTLLPPNALYAPRSPWGSHTLPSFLLVLCLRAWRIARPLSPCFRVTMFGHPLILLSFLFLSLSSVPASPVRQANAPFRVRIASRSTGFSRTAGAQTQDNIPTFDPDPAVGALPCDQHAQSPLSYMTVPGVQRRAIQVRASDTVPQRNQPQHRHPSRGRLPPVRPQRRPGHPEIPDPRPLRRHAGSGQPRQLKWR